VDDRREISAISLYLVQYHGRKTFDRWLNTGSIEPPDSTVRHGRDQDAARAIVFAMGLEYVESWARTPGQEGHFNYRIDRGTQVFELGGADYMVRLTSRKDVGNVGDIGLVVAWEDSLGVVLSDSAGTVAVASVDSVFTQIERNLTWNEHAIPADVMRVSAESARARLTVYFTMLSGVTRGGTAKVDYINADCFVILK
jgi:hypothetical protein